MARHSGASLKPASILFLIYLIPGHAFGQASNMISISALREESNVASAYNLASVQQLMKTAVSAEDFGHLADYFDNQAEIYAARYEDEQNELYRLLALRYHARSYPAQLENTRNRVAHFKELLHKCSEQARAYRERVNAADMKTELAVKTRPTDANRPQDH